MHSLISGRWEFREAGGAWLPAAVPGCVHTDLLAAGLIGDPFYRTNEDSLQWIGERDWEYRTVFDIPEVLLEHERVELIFEGLDTYASVALNGEPLLEADNMFRIWTVPCRGLLREGDNELLVRFRSPLRVEAEKRAASPYGYPGGDRVFTRKAAYHYGWDWGPRFVTCGIWRPVRLRAWSGARITDVHARTAGLEDGHALLRVDVEIESTGPIEARVFLEPDDPAMPRAESETRLGGGIDTLSFDIGIDDPDPWWPSGLGEQAIQRFTVSLSAERRILDSRCVSTGICSVRLVDEPDGRFHFTVNGEPVFMKGANWIPLDSFVPRASPGDYRRLLVAAKEAGMNMLRVWGGGIYEQDIFYDLCDSLGLLVWQDFMFACAMHPGDEAFLRSVEAEARDNIRRLRNHPCIALWCGNNESAEGWANWGWQAGYDELQRAAVWSAYDTLFHHILPAAVRGHDGARAYAPSSPRYGRADPRSLAEGDAHYWGVWHDAEPFSVLEEKVPRFMSEFGHQSYPSMRTIESFTLPGDRQIGSAVLRSHQKHPRGDGLIRLYMEREYRVPDGFEAYVYLSQVVQAGGIRRGLEAHRRAMPYCMGTLFWQLNDCWPVASWSSIDDHGRWKALHYAAREAFADILVSPARRGDSLFVYIVSDRRETAAGTLRVRLFDLDGWELVRRHVEISAPPRSSTVVFAEAAAALLRGHDPRRAVLSLAFDTGGQRYRGRHYFVPPNELDLPEAHVRWDAEPDGANWRLRLWSGALARAVHLELDGQDGWFSDNFFDIMPGDTVRVLLTPSSPIDRLEGRLRIMTLKDTYQ
ncbi:MAG: glycoside hydrolase family 2 protein [Candidatus Krumholzibacteria bacterium]|nr:glycoside hydrolase family 2 protein [Candidatus Krumholzibacteria bacterium]